MRGVCRDCGRPARHAHGNRCEEHAETYWWLVSDSPQLWAWDQLVPVKLEDVFISPAERRTVLH